jgi:hypothetical protein
MSEFWNWKPSVTSVRYKSAAIQAEADKNDELIWRERGSVLAQEKRLRQLETADWLVLGIERYGATKAYDYAESVFPQYTRTTFQSWVTVAKHFPGSIRIESDHLTFGHYQAAQGAEGGAAEQMVWIRKADEHKMSVAALREAIANAYRLLHPDPTTTPVDEPEPEPKKVKRNIFGKPIPEFKTPWLKHQTRWALDQLARARHVTTEQLLQRIIQDFLDAHSDEIGDAEKAAKKRQAEHFAQMDAAEAVEKVKWEANQRYREQQNAKQSAEQQQVAVPPKTIIDAATGDVPCDSKKYSVFISERASKIIRDKLPKAGLRDQAASTAVKNYLLRGANKAALNKISEADFERLLSALEAGSPEDTLGLVNP